MEILPVRDRAAWGRFIRLPRSIYGRESLWVSPLDFERKRFLDPRRNPFFQYASMEAFLARDRQGRDVGRIAAIANPRYVEFQKRECGFFGFFDTIDDAEVAKELLGAAEAWVRSKGYPTIHGPVSPSTNHECGVLVSGFDRPPLIQMPYNHEYYGRLLEAQGYRGVQDLVAYEYAVDGRVPDRLEHALELLQRRKSFRLRPIDFKRYDEELALVKLIYNEAWSANYGFVPLSDAEIDWLAGEMKPFLRPDHCAFAEVDGEVAGVMILLGDLNQALRPLRGRLFPLGWWTLLRGMKRIDAMRAMVMGIRPGFRKIGIDHAFYFAGLKVAHARGYKTIELSWILAHNVEILRSLERLEAKETKRYRLYEKSLT